MAAIASPPAPVLYPAVPVDWLWMPKPLRKGLGYLTMVLFAWTFFSPLMIVLLVIPYMWRHFPLFTAFQGALLALSFLIPLREW